MDIERELFEEYTAASLAPVGAGNRIAIIRKVLRESRTPDGYGDKQPLINGMWTGWLLCKQRHLPLEHAARDLVARAEGEQIFTDSAMASGYPVEALIKALAK